ncbi:MAG: hypothetical protein AAF456_23535 [Planctomycetota bacterium]
MKHGQIFVLFLCGVTILIILAFARYQQQSGPQLAEPATGVDSTSLDPGGLQLMQEERRDGEFPETAVVLSRIPFVQKRPDFGGEACVCMMLQAMGESADQDFVFDQSGVDPMLGRGCVTRELVEAVRNIGFRTGETWFPYSEAQRATAIQRDWEMISDDIEQGIPSVACLSREGIDSFVLITGIDTSENEIYYHDPADLHGDHKKMTLQEWYDAACLPSTAPGEGFLVRIRLAPDRIMACAVSETFSAADYAQHIRKLRPRIPGEDFNLVIQHPFVVIGNKPAEQIEGHAERTVQWAVDKIKQLYFEDDPEEIIDIWLFKDKATYDAYNVQLFGSRPSTPFGYYSPVDRALVMNISTGGGTLVHEIVHPFIASNFPRCPSWFNEGLASLYEQSREEDGRIMGSTNWRLRGLQAAIEEERIGTFLELCNTTRREFYGDIRGTNYAQARYLCYYLQEKQLLVSFYHRFRENVADDPSGYDTLQEVLGNPDMDDFQSEWEQFIMRLRF